MPVRRLDRLRAAAPWIAATLMVAGVVHIATILLMPAVSRRDAFARIEALGPRATVIPVAPARPGRELAVFNDPATAIAVCRYDLADGPLRLSAQAPGDDFVSLSFRTRDNVVFYAMTDRAALRGAIDVVVSTQDQLDATEAQDAEDSAPAETRLVSPTREGYVYMRALAATPGQAEEAAARLRAVVCGVEAP